MESQKKKSAAPFSFFLSFVLPPTTTTMMRATKDFFKGGRERGAAADFISGVFYRNATDDDLPKQRVVVYVVFEESRRGRGDRRGDRVCRWDDDGW